MSDATRTGKDRRARRQPRIQRPLLTRSEPIRSFAGIFGAPEPAANQSPKTATESPPGQSPPNGDGVGRSVNAGYRVIEEYLRQGQEVARALWPGARGGSTPSAEPLNMTERMIRSASDFAGLFSEFLQTFSLPGTLPPPGSQPIPGFGIADVEKDSHSPPSPSAPHEDDDPTLFSLDIQSKRRTEITLDLKPKSWTTVLDVHDLRSAGAGAHRLVGITATCLPDERRVVFRIRIPDRQPAGTYSGIVVDRSSNLPRGTLSVRVLAGVKKK
jgi:hypothetical protein